MTTADALVQNGRMGTPDFGVRRRSLVVGAGLACVVARASADDGASLATEIHQRASGSDLTLRSAMQLTDRGRPPRSRQIISYRKRSGDTTSALVRFLAPADIAGVGLLSHTSSQGDSEQSLYLPELDRVRRVAGNRKGGRFVGSDLYFEDLEERHPSRDNHLLRGQDVFQGIRCELLESSPRRPDDSVYLRRLSWIDRATAMPLRIDFFERDPQTVSKRWLALDRQQIQGFWTVTASSMADLSQGSETRLIVESARYDRKLPDRLFTPRALADERYESEFRL